VNYPTETLTFGNERQTYNVHQSLNQHAKSRPNNQLKNQSDKKPFHINIIATLFAPSLPAKNQNPNKLNHLPHQLQGRQHQNSPSVITRVIR
jgi:hypothetical protein